MLSGPTSDSRVRHSVMFRICQTRDNLQNSKGQAVPHTSQFLRQSSTNTQMHLLHIGFEFPHQMCLGDWFYEIAKHFNFTWGKSIDRRALCYNSTSETKTRPLPTAERFYTVSIHATTTKAPSCSSHSDLRWCMVNVMTSMLKHNELPSPNSWPLCLLFD